VSGGAELTSQESSACTNLVFWHGEEDAVLEVCKENILVYLPFEFPSNDFVASAQRFDAVVVFSPLVAEEITDKFPGLSVPVLSLVPPLRTSKDGEIDLGLPDIGRDYRFYAVVPSHEVGIVYPVVREFLAEYRDTDFTRMVLVTDGDRDEVVKVVDFIVAELDLPKTRVARIHVLSRPWSFQLHWSLAAWGDCLICPWAGISYPLEVGYALLHGNFVVSHTWLCGRLLSETAGCPVKATMSPQGFVDVDWEQVASMIRLAAANGRREHYPAYQTAEIFLAESGRFLQDLMANLGVVFDQESRSLP